MNEDRNEMINIQGSLGFLTWGLWSYPPIMSSSLCVPPQSTMCVPAPPVSSSALTTLAVWCAPVTAVTATTASDTGTARSPTA